MKIGYITDTHLRAETPEGRTDNFNRSCLLKLEEAGQIFNDEKCDAIFHGGDWGDRPDIPYSVYNDLASTLIRWGKPIYGVIGSHDYYGYEIKSLKRTAVGALFSSGIVELIGSKGMESAVDLGEVIVCGTPHTSWLDSDVENYYHPRYNEDKVQIQLTHGTLLEKPAPFQYILLQDVKTESDIVLGAHYHPGWKKVHHFNNTYFAHPGSLARLDNTGVERIPKVLIIDTSSESKEFFKFVPLQTAIPHPFKEKIKESKEEIPTLLVSKVLDLIQTTQINMIDIKQQLPKVAKELGYDKEVLEEAFLLIEETESEK